MADSEYSPKFAPFFSFVSFNCIVLYTLLLTDKQAGIAAAVSSSVDTTLRGRRLANTLEDGLRVYVKP
jgi:hypothetical protein